MSENSALESPRPSKRGVERAYKELSTVKRYRLVAACILCSIVSGCGGASSTTPPQYVPTIANITEPASIVGTGGTITFPSIDGYGATFVYSANDGPGTSASVETAAVIPTIPGPPPPGQPLIAFEFTLASSVTFQHSS